MSGLAFDKPLVVFVGLDFLRQIDTVAEAQELLTEWPQRRRGSAYAAAVQSCEGACRGSASIEQARRSVQWLCHSVNMLAPEADPIKVLPLRQDSRRD